MKKNKNEPLIPDITEDEIRIKFSRAIRNNEQDIINYYLQYISKSEKPFVKNIIANIGWHWVFNAVKNKNYTLVEKLLELGAEPDKLYHDKDDLTPLHVAAANGDLKMAKILLAYITKPFNDTFLCVGQEQPTAHEEVIEGRTYQLHQSKYAPIMRRSSPIDIAHANSHTSIEAILIKFQKEKLKKVSKAPAKKVETDMSQYGTVAWEGHPPTKIKSSYALRSSSDEQLKDPRKKPLKMQMGPRGMLFWQASDTDPKSLPPKIRKTKNGVEIRLNRNRKK